MAKVTSERNGKETEKKLSRRQFLALGGATAVGTAGLLVGSSLLEASKAEVAVASSVKYGMVIDLERCFGCRACMEACKVENNTPTAVFWMYVFRFEEGQYPNVRVTYLPRPCMHCDNAPCVKVCPVGARYKRADGLVATDQERCIGCRYCATACPYSVNYFNWKDPKRNQYLDWEAAPAALREVTKDAIPPYQNPDLDELYGEEKRLIAGGSHFKGVIGKCTFCVQRVEKGLPPACVATCPVHALHFGDLNDQNSDVSTLLQQKPSFRLLEEANTEPSVYYLGNRPNMIESRLLEAVTGRV